jgi:hypothetical protein
VDKSNLLRPILAVSFIFVFMGAAQAGQVKEKDLSDVVANQEEIQKPAPVVDTQGSAADDAKEGFSSGAKGIGQGFKNGAMATGRGFKWLGGKMGSGLKTAGVSIKNFFTGKYFGFGKKDQVEERDLKAEDQGAGEAKVDMEQIQSKPNDEDLEMEDTDSKNPEKNNDWSG